MIYHRSSRVRAAAAVALGLAASVGTAVPADAQVSFETVALTGQAAPGAPAGTTYSTFDSLAVNNTGRLVYKVVLAGSGVTTSNDAAIYAGNAGAPQLIAREGAPAPGAPAGVNYSDFVSPRLNDAGQLAFWGKLAGAGVTTANQEAIFVGNVAAGAPQLVVRAGGQAPSALAGVNFELFGWPTLSAAGHVAYQASLVGAGVTTANDNAIYAGDPAAPQLVARQGDPAPGTPTGVTYGNALSRSNMNSAGQIAYQVELAGSGVTAFNDGAIYAGSPVAPQLIAREGDPAPGTAAGVNYAYVGAAGVNEAGQLLYTATLSGAGVNGVNDGVIYAGSPAAPQLVAREGDHAPGMPAGVTYQGFNGTSYNDAGQVAYRAFLIGGGVTGTNNTGIFAGDPADPQLVAREGDPAPGMPAGVNYSTLQPPGITDAGRLVFPASLAGTGVTTANDTALFLLDPALGHVLIAREGNLFDVGGGDLRTISTILYNVSDGGLLALNLRFTDGTQGIFGVQVPEPTGLASMAAGAYLLTARRRRRASCLFIASSSR